MGKSLDDLHLTDQPIRQPAATDARDQDWYKFAEEITALVESGSYEWALETLAVIKATVERLERVSEGQRRAVRNIEEARSSYRARHGRSRRYEGYGGGR